MSDLSIKVNIAGRVYPLNINRDQEENVRKAAKHINAEIKKLQDNYAVRDVQDLLAMTALQLANQLRTGEREVAAELVSDELQELEATLDNFLG